MSPQTQVQTEDPGALLQYLVDSGKIDLGSAEEEMKKSKLQEILEKHPYKIYQGKDGTHIFQMTARLKNAERL